MKNSPYVKLIANRTNGSGFLIVANSEEELKQQLENDGAPKHCIDIKFPIPNLHLFNAKEKIFTGILHLIVSNLPYQDFKVKSAFADLVKEAESVAKSIVSTPFKGTKPPEKSDTEVDSFGKLQEVVDMAKEEIEVVNTAKDKPEEQKTDVFGGFQHYNMSDVPEIKDAWFIGTFIKDQKNDKEGHYLILTTPHDDFDKQFPIIFKKERTSIFVYSALLQHPEYRKIVSSMAPFSINNIELTDQAATKCIYVVDGLKFIQSL